MNEGGKPERRALLGGHHNCKIYPSFFATSLLRSFGCLFPQLPRCLMASQGACFFIQNLDLGFHVTLKGQFHQRSERVEVEPRLEAHRPAWGATYESSPPFL